MGYGVSGPVCVCVGGVCGGGRFVRHKHITFHGAVISASSYLLVTGKYAVGEVAFVFAFNCGHTFAYFHIYEDTHETEDRSWFLDRRNPPKTA